MMLIGLSCFLLITFCSFIRFGISNGKYYGQSKKVEGSCFERRIMIRLCGKIKYLILVALTPEIRMLNLLSFLKI